jgi:hypothetical protein
MAQTKLDLSDNKFEQLSTEALHLSGCTHVYGQFRLESGSTLSILPNFANGKILTSNASGVATWKNPSVANGLSLSGTTIVLGGTLINTGGTIVEIGKNSLYFYSCANSNRGISLNQGLNEARISWSDTGTTCFGLAYYRPDCVHIESVYPGGGCRAAIDLTQSNNRICFKSQSAFQTYHDCNGLWYTNDYSGTGVSARWIPDKGYVDSQISGNTQVTGDRITKLICQNSHGFLVKDVIGWSGGTYNKAIANGLYNGEVLGIVSKCYNANCFDLTQAGYVTGLTSLVTNTTYFLSDVTPGLLTAVEPTGNTHISKTMLIANSSTTAWVLPYPGYYITTGTTGGGTVTGADNGLTLSGTIIELGGPLIQNTCINTDAGRLVISGNTSHPFGLYVQSNVVSLGDYNLANQYCAYMAVDNSYATPSIDAYVEYGGSFGEIFSDGCAMTCMSQNISGVGLGIVSIALNYPIISSCDSNNGCCLALSLSPTYFNVCDPLSCTFITMDACSINPSIDLWASSGCTCNELFLRPMTGDMWMYQNIHNVGAGTVCLKNNHVCLQSSNTGATYTLLCMTPTDINLFGITKLGTTPSIGSCTDSILVWNPGTCRINKVPYISGATAGMITGATNLGSGNGTIYTTVSGNKIQLKTLSGGTNITLTCNGNYIAINTTSSPAFGWSNLSKGSTVAGCGTVASGGTICCNTFYGVCAGKGIVAGCGNVGIGFQALTADTGNFNIGIGYQALLKTTGPDNVGIGAYALTNNAGGNFNIGIGKYALQGNTCGIENTGIGAYALYTNTKGNDNVAVGKSALLGNTSGCYNTGVGTYAVGSNTTASGNTGVGYYANYTNSTSHYNTAIGLCALRLNIACQNTALGSFALTNNSTGIQNIAVGYQALYCNTTGGNNIAIGQQALCSNTGGTANIAIGSQALLKNTCGIANTAIGCWALCSNTIGCYNIGVGYLALYSNTGGTNNIGIGVQALVSNCRGSNNIALGNSSLYSNNIGCNNIALGFASVQTNTSGSGNIGIGCNTLFSNSIGKDNIALGTFALTNNTTGNYNFAAGCMALYGNKTTCNNTAIGRETLVNNSGGTNNVAIGYQVLYSTCNGNNNFGVGYGALSNNSTGSNNIGLGYQALCCNTRGYNNIALGAGSMALSTSAGSHDNVGFGCQTLYYNTGGTDNFALGYNSLVANCNGCNNIAIGRTALGNNLTGSDNIGIGYLSLTINTRGCFNIGLGNYSLYGNTTGCHNIGFGQNALNGIRIGSNNIAFGQQTLWSNTGGTLNIAIGACALRSNVSGSRNIAIGCCAGYSELGSDKLYIANSGTIYPLICGDFAGRSLLINGSLSVTGVTAGACTDSILVWNSTDKCVKKVPYVSGNTALSIFTITGNSTATGFTVNHAKNQQFVSVQVVKNSTPYDTIYTSVQRPNANCICITFDVAPANGQQYKIVITS